MTPRIVPVNQTEVYYNGQYYSVNSFEVTKENIIENLKNNLENLHCEMVGNSKRLPYKFDNVYCTILIDKETQDVQKTNVTKS
ncbi:MAG: hypothetical protein JSS63_09470 [Bacteroidetes bacterium]|nr:hypothetical protein [Bacteroidota bacterium]